MDRNNSKIYITAFEDQITFWDQELNVIGEKKIDLTSSMHEVTKVIEKGGSLIVYEYAVPK